MNTSEVRAATAKEMMTPINATLHMSSIGNPDYRQDPSKGLPGVPDEKIQVSTLREASDQCAAYIEKYDLGSGNWGGGQLLIGNRLVGQVSYNGRVWVFQDWLDPAPAPVAEKLFVLKATTSDGDGVSEYFVVEAGSLEAAVSRLLEEFPGTLVEEASLHEAYRGGVALLNEIGSAEL